MKKLPFKIECEIEEIEAIMTALNFERNRLIADGDDATAKLIAEAIHRVADFTTNDR